MQHLKTFLKDSYNLHRDPQLFQQTEKNKKVNISDPNSIIGNLMRKYQLALSEFFDDGESNRPLQAIKNYLYQNAVLKIEDIPQKYWDLQAKILRERGEGYRLEEGSKFPEHEKIPHAQTLISDQQQTLDRWLEYLASNDAPYPIELKYWVMRSIVALQTFDKEKMKFPKRSKGTTSNFPELNHEALAYVLNAKQAELEKKPLQNFGLTDSDFQTFCEKKKFADRYALALSASVKDNAEDLINIKGEWKVYPQGSQADELVASLEWKGTGRCTAGYETARKQLQDGDFYVYYSEEQGKNTKPRLAIRMEGNHIAEVRGIAEDQNLDSFIAPVLEKKLKTFGKEWVNYQEKLENMKTLTLLEAKIHNHEPLSDQELRFLYFKKVIEGFGYMKDPRVEEFQNTPHVLNQLSDYFVRHPYRKGNLRFTTLSSLPENFIFPKVIWGNLMLWRMTSLPQNFQFPDKIGGDIELSSLKELPEYFQFPQIIKGDLNLSSLRRIPETCKLSKQIWGSLYLNNLKSLSEKFILPHSIWGNFNLSTIKSLPENIVFPKTIGGWLNLLDLEVFPEHYSLPESIWEDFILSTIKSLPDNIVFPKTIGGTLHLSNLEVFPEHYSLPESIWKLYFGELTKLPQDFKIPNNLKAFYAKRLTEIPSDFRFPEHCSEAIDLQSLEYLPQGFQFPKVVKRLNLAGLKILPEGCLLPQMIANEDKWFLKTKLQAMILRIFPKKRKPLLPAWIGTWWDCRLGLNNLTILPKDITLPRFIDGRISLRNLTTISQTHYQQLTKACACDIDWNKNLEIKE